MTAVTLPPSLANNRRLDRWVAIDPNGMVDVRTGKVEIGQGIVSALAQIAAEELDVDYARIRMIPADTVRSPNEGVTAGSTSTSQSGGALRQVCASPFWRRPRDGSARTSTNSPSAMAPSPVARAMRA